MSNRSEKARALVLAALMVLSVVAMGVAFTGGAAADTNISDDTSVNASVSANPADYHASAHDNASVHTISLVVDDNLAGTNPDAVDFVVDYSDDFGIGEDNSDTVFAAQADISLELIRNGDIETADGSLTDTDSDVTTDSANNNVTVTLRQASVTDNELKKGDIIRLVLDSPTTSGVGDFQNPGPDGDTNVTIDVDSGTQVEEVELALGDEAPIGVDDTSVSTPGNYSSLQQAVSDLSASAEAITVREDVYELQAQPNAVAGLSGATVGQSDFSISSESSLANVSVPDLTGAQYIDLGDEDNITVDTVGFTIDDRYDSGTSVATAIYEDGSSDGTDNLTVTNNEFYGFSGTTVDVVLVDIGNDGAAHEISGNTFSNVAEAISVQADGTNMGDSDQTETVTISNNNVKSFSGANAFTLNGLAQYVDLTFEANDFDGNGGSGNTAIYVQATSENVTITDGVINDTSGSDAIDISASPGTTGDYVKVTGTEIRNLGSAHDAVAISTASSDDVIVNDVTVDQSPSAIGVDVSDANPTVSVTDSLINNTDIGVDAQTAGTVTISGTTIDYAQTQAVNLITPGDGADIEINGSTSIDQSASGIKIDLSDSSTGNDQRVDVNGVTVNGTSGPAVQIAGLDSADSAKYPIVNVSDSTFTQNNQGLDITDASEPNSQVNAHFNTFEENTKGIQVADLSSGGELVVNATFNDFVESGDYGLDVADQGGSSDRVNANYNWWGATNGPGGDFSGNGSSVDYTSASDISIDPATVKKDDGNVALEQDFLGVVKDSQNVTLNGSSSDATYSFATNEEETTVLGEAVDPNTVPGANNSAEVDGTLVLGLNGTDYVFKDALNEGEVNTSVSGAEADSGKNGTSIANTTPTGDTAITVVGNNSTTAVSDTGTIRLVHEVQNIGEGYTLTSLPQPAEVYTTDVTDFTSWSNANSNYNDSALSTDGSLVRNSEAIHKGQYANGDSSDARIGYDFVTPSESDVQLGAGGVEELGEGFHLVGSNYNIEGSNTEIVNQDLSTVRSLPENAGDYQGNESFVVYEPVSFGEVGGSSTVDNYEGYWVYVDVGEDTETRTIKLARYDPAAS